MAYNNFKEQEKKRREMLRRVTQQQQMEQYQKDKSNLLERAGKTRSIAGKVGKAMSNSNNSTVSKIGNSLYKGSGQELIDTSKTNIKNMLTGNKPSIPKGTTYGNISGGATGATPSITNIGANATPTLSNFSSTATPTLSNFGAGAGTTATTGASNMGAIGNAVAANASGATTAGASSLGTIGGTAASTAGAGTAAGTAAGTSAAIGSGTAATGAAAGGAAAGAGTAAAAAVPVVGWAVAAAALAKQIYDSYKQKQNAKAMEASNKELNKSQNLHIQNVANARQNIEQANKENNAMLNEQATANMNDDKNAIMQNIMKNVLGEQAQPTDINSNMSSMPVNVLSNPSGQLTLDNAETTLNEPANSSNEIGVDKAVNEIANNDFDPKETMTQTILNNVLGGEQQQPTIDNVPTEVAQADIPTDKPDFTDKVKDMLGRVTQGYNENTKNDFNVNNLTDNTYTDANGTQEKNWANRVGEAVGTTQRMLSKPAVQGLIAGIGYNARNDDPWKALEFGANWANTKAKSDMYGKYVGGDDWKPSVFSGNFDATDFKAKTDSTYKDKFNQYRTQKLLQDAYQKSFKQLDEQLKNGEITPNEFISQHEALNNNYSASGITMTPLYSSMQLSNNTRDTNSKITDRKENRQLQAQDNKSKDEYRKGAIKNGAERNDIAEQKLKLKQQQEQQKDLADNTKVLVEVLDDNGRPTGEKRVCLSSVAEQKIKEGKARRVSNS